LSFSAAALEFFSLARARRAVRERSPEARREVRARYLAARSRLRVAEQLSPETELGAALPLYREGFAALVGACIAAVEGCGREVAYDVEAAWADLGRVWPLLKIPASLDRFRLARDLLCRAPSLEVQPVEREEAVAACDQLTHLVALLTRAVEPRTMGQLRRSRAIRVAPFVAALVAIPLALGRYDPVASSANLALHTTVTLSSKHPHSVAPPDGLVNGKVEFAYGAHTDIQEDPWILVDLGRPVHIGKIVVYNRGDGYLDECLPLIVEAGLDRYRFEPVATRNDVFTSTNPWVIDKLDTTAQYVRLRKTGKTYIALSELAVYGR
jgi:hypothetical protein